MKKLKKSLTVAELIEVLKTLPPDKNVLWPDFTQGYMFVTGASIGVRDEYDPCVEGHVMLDSNF